MQRRWGTNVDTVERSEIVQTPAVKMISISGFLARCSFRIHGMVPLDCFPLPARRDCTRNAIWSDLQCIWTCCSRAVIPNNKKTKEAKEKIEMRAALRGCDTNLVLSKWLGVWSVCLLKVVLIERRAVEGSNSSFLASDLVIYAKRILARILATHRRNLRILATYMQCLQGSSPYKRRGSSRYIE